MIYVMCPDCGHRMYLVYYSEKSAEEYRCDYCEGNEYDEDDSESKSVYDAALIWASKGKDEDYTFGFSEDELEDALLSSVSMNANH